MKQISFHSGRNPEFGMSKNRAPYQTNEPNACAQCVWPWKIGRTNLTGTVCAAAMLLQKHSTHEEIRESAKVNYWVGSHNPAQTSSGSMIWVVNQWWIWMISRCKFFCTQNLLSSLDPSNSYSCLSQWSFDQIFWPCGLQGDLLWYLSTSAPCFHVKPRSNEE